MSPTIKQKKAFKAVVGNGGNITKAMLGVGYSPATANTPQKLTESKGWQELLEEELPDNELAKIHKELLHKRDSKRVFNHSTGEYEDVIENQPETQAASKALEMAYKLKGRMKENAPQVNVQFNSFQDLTNEQLEAIRKRASESGSGTSNEGTSPKEIK